MFGISALSGRRFAAATAVAVAACVAIVLVAIPSRAADPEPNAHRHAAAAAAPKISYKKARKILLAKVIKPKSLAAGDDLIAFRLKKPLARKTKIRVHRDHGSSITLRKPAWFFWIDDDPKAMFEHPTRYVLIDASSGKVKVLKRDWWPEIKGKAPWFEYAAYWKASSWAYSTLPVLPAKAARSGAKVSKVAASPPVRTAASTTECAVIVDGAGDAKAGTVDDANGMEKVIGTTFGYTTKKLTPPNNNKADFEKAVADLIADGCKDVLLFISSHGTKASVQMGGGNYTAAEMKKLIEANPTIGFKVVIEACKAGSWITPLGGKPLITITSTDSEKPSYSADPDTASDPNPGDTGTEFTSGLIEDLELIPKTPALIQRVQECVAKGKSIMVCKLEIAFESAVAKDEDAAAGREVPQRSP